MPPRNFESNNNMRRTNKRLILISLIGAAMLVTWIRGSFGQNDLLTIKATPPTLKELSGPWFGWADGHGDVFLYRLDITTNGITMGSHFAPGPVSVFRTSSATLTNANLTLKFVTQSSGESLTASGTASGNWDKPMSTWTFTKRR